MRLINKFERLFMDKLVIRSATCEDVLTLQAICDAWIEKGFFEGETLPYNYIEQCLMVGDLPPIPEAKIENYYLFVIEDNHRIIGLFDIYDGYPQLDTAWISLFLLDVDSRGQGIGKALIQMITKTIREVGFDSIGLAISMNNRVALKFLISNGFNVIIGMYGDLKFPIIGLKKQL